MTTTDDGFRAVTNFDYPTEPMESSIGNVSYEQWLEHEEKRWAQRGCEAEIRHVEGKCALFVKESKSWVFLGRGSK